MNGPNGTRRTKTVVTLSIAQALGLAGGPLVVMVGGVVGRELAPAPSLATLPLAAMVVGTALGSAPAALLMQRTGRRRGLALGATVGLVAAGLAALAIDRASFTGFCLAALLAGGHTSFVMQYRFAAADAAGPERAARAVAYVLAGGIIAGLLGPELGSRGRDLLQTPWTGSFSALAAVYALLIAVLLIGLDDDLPASRPAARAARAGGDLHRLLRTPAFLVAVAAGVTAYAVMSLLMTATPLAMHGAGHHVDATAIVIQAHVVAMYAPSLIAGPLVARFGLARLMGAGLLALAACATVGMHAASLPTWILALVLLGVGWNLLFLGGTVALAQAFPGDDRYRAQALNDALVFGAQAVASLSAGVVLAHGGWSVVNIVALTGLAGMALLLARHGVRVRRRRTAQAA